MERPAVRRELPLLLELSGLCGLAVALPVLDVLGRSPDFLVLERLDARDLVFLAAVVGALSSAAMLRAWRPAAAVIIVAAAVITPSQDPISLFAMAVPMWLFYFAAAAIARYIIEPRRSRRQALAGTGEP